MNGASRISLTTLLLLAGCLEKFELDPPGTDGAGGTSMDGTSSCGSAGANCCPPDVARCESGLRCDEETSTCVDEEPRLCMMDTQCHQGQTCCRSGLLGTCTSLGPGQACPAPDLVVTTTQETLRFSIEPRVFSPDTSAADACAIEKGCVGGSGLRHLLRFSIEVENQGDADLLIGEPETSTAFTRAACDGQLYFPRYLTYQLFDVGGTAVPGTETQVQGRCQALPAEFSARFNCEFWGLWSGFSESFIPNAVTDPADPAGLDCQWVDITGLSEGSYVLRVTVNPDRPSREAVLREPTQNNTKDFALNLPNLSEPTRACPTILQDAVDPAGGGSLLGQRTERECGWAFVTTTLGSTCVPGETVVLSCSSCDQRSNPMLRVCEGFTPCVAQAALGAGDQTFSVFDDVSMTSTLMLEPECQALEASDPFRYSCVVESDCPTVQFTCPPSGEYAALSAAVDPNASATCEATLGTESIADAGP
jgi:hypothetical protein